MRPDDATGIVERHAELRAAFGDYAYQPPDCPDSWRKRAAKVVPGGIDEGKLRERIAELETELTKAKLENGRLQIIVSELKAPLMLREPVEIVKVMNAFCTAMNCAGRLVFGEAWTVEHLRSPRRSYVYSRPRQVCMWVVRQICSTASLPQIARAFGGRDHTTAIHACSRAPEIMSTDPGVHAVALSVLRSFGCPERGATESGGTP